MGGASLLRCKGKLRCLLLLCLRRGEGRVNASEPRSLHTVYRKARHSKRRAGQAQTDWIGNFLGGGEVDLRCCALSFFHIRVSLAVIQTAPHVGSAHSKVFYCVLAGECAAER